MPSREPCAGVNVLVVDDHQDSRDMLVQFLEFRGFNVFQAKDGVEAIELAGRHKPSVVLMDLQLPGIDGWEATRRLKADPTTQQILVIAVTAHAFKHQADAAREAGCDALIAKPYDLVVLADFLARVSEQGLSPLDVSSLRPHDVAGR
jgi:two-component system, cell cycle response regulator DivK